MRNVSIDTSCAFCDMEEKMDHLFFFLCPFSKKMLSGIMVKLGKIGPFDWQHFLSWVIHALIRKTTKNLADKLAVLASIYYI